jgi:methyl-accepting chemotaxis protein
VVADEVRNLAQRAAGAAKSTSALIETTVRKISEGTALVERTNGDFQGVARAVRTVTELVGDISAATQEQDRGIAEIGSSLAEIDHVTQENAANA